MMLRLSILVAFVSVAFMSVAAKVVELLPDRSVTLDGYSRDEAQRRFSMSDIHEIEGIWRFVDDGSVMAIERFEPEELPDNDAVCYRIVVVKSPVRAIAPGSLMGYICPTAKKGVYDASVYTEFDGISGLHKPQKFYLELSDDGLLTFNRYREGIQLNLWRLIPYMFRYSVKRRSERPKGLDGCRRVYPEPLSVPLEPRYL